MQDHPVNPERFNYIPTRKPVIQSGVLGMLIFLFTELMLFAGFVSAFLIVKANAVGGIWPPPVPKQPRLPIEQTLFNSSLLIASGVLIFLAHRALRARSDRFNRLFGAAIVTGCAFVVLQGAEWVALISQGMTLTSSLQGSFFYVIIGLHGLHAVAAIIVLVNVMRKSLKGTMKDSQFFTAEVFWYFVVGIWPILYWQVYL